MSTDVSNYAEAKTAQTWFREAIDVCMKGQVDELQSHVDKYLQSNPKISAQDLLTDFKSEGKTLIHVAASSGHHGVLNYLVSKSSQPGELVNVADERGFTPIINATVSESDAAMLLLLQLGANVNARNKDGAAAIHFAAGDGSVSRLKLLCDAGTDISVMSQAGNALHWAAGKGRGDAIRFLVNQGADINVISPSGLPAVLMAAVSSCDDGVKTLVEGGAEVGLIVTGNVTVLHISAEHGLVEAVRAIISTEDGKKCCTVATDDGNLPIHLAAMSGHGEIVSMLHPLSFDAKDVTKGSPPSVETLLAEGQTRLKEWEEKNNAKQIASAGSGGNGVDGSGLPSYGDGSVLPFTAEQLEPTTPAVSPEAEAESETWKEKGNEAYKRKDYRAAIDAYTKAINLRGDNATFWSNRSACYLSMGEEGYAQRALLDAEVCRRLVPTWTKGCYRLAAARLALKQYEDAALAAFEGCKLDESNQELKEMMRKCVRLGQEEYQQKLDAAGGMLIPPPAPPKGSNARMTAASASAAPSTTAATAETTTTASASASASSAKP